MDFQQNEFSEDNLDQLMIGFIVLMYLHNLMYLFLFPMLSAQGLFY